jgi:hypothetical protein
MSDLPYYVINTVAYVVRSLLCFFFVSLGSDVRVEYSLGAMIRIEE